MQKDKPRDERYTRLLATRAEQAVIGVMLLAPKAYGKISTLLSSEDFEDKRFRAIYEAAGRLQASGKAIDEITLIGALKVKNVMEERAIVVLAEAAKSVPHTRHLSEYMAMVKEASRKRKLVAECERCIEAVLGGGGSMESSESLRAFTKKLFETGGQT